MLTWCQFSLIMVGFLLCFLGGLCYGYEAGKGGGK